MGFKQHIIELGGISYRVLKNKVDIVDKFESVPDDAALICDLPGSISRVMTVEAPIKYAEAMVIRKLQEEGEFDEAVSVITHQKIKRSAKSTQIFFTAVASKIYLQYLDRIEEHDDITILIPIYTVLFNFLKKISSSKPVALIFRHGTFADVLIGTKKRVYFSSRCTGFDTSPEQISSLWEMVSNDIETVQEENKFELDQIICMNWLDTCSDDVINHVNPDYIEVEKETFFFQNEPCNISFLNAVKLVPVTMGKNHKRDWFLYWSRKVSLAAALLLLGVSLALIGIQYYFIQKTDGVKTEISQVEKNIGQMQKKISLKPFNPQFNEAFSFVDDIDYNQKAPSFKAILHDMGKGLLSPVKVENLKITYTDKEVKTEVYGRIKSNFDTAYKGYQVLLKTLENNGYEITESSLNTQIEQSEFRFTFTGRIQ